ncbi:MAG: hypothetical protein HZC40_05185 [Chloroflexi bacterium]|nr:hypothetical protein [Chloroflexota bacterium]
MYLDSTLTQLERAQLVRQLNDVEATYQFRHTLTQETIYQSLLRTTRREIHLRVAQSLEILVADHLDEFAALLAQHYGEAGDDAKTFEHALRAGDVAARVYAHAEAEMHYARAIESGSHPERSPERKSKEAESKDATQLKNVYLKRGRVLELSARYDDADVNYLELETRGRAQNQRALELAALLARATLHATPTARYDLGLAQELLGRALALARELDDPAAEAKTLWSLMLVNYFQSNFDQAIALGEQSLALARQLDAREQMAYALHDLSRNYIARGRADEGRAAITQARALWRELDNLPMLADNLATSAEGCFFLGEFSAARAFADEAYQISITIGNLWNQAYSRWTLGYLALETGEITEGIRALRDAVEVGKQSGFIAAMYVAQGMLGWAIGLLGDLQQGIAIVQAIPHEQTISIGFRSWHLGVLAQLHLLNGELAQAETIVARAYIGLDLNDLTWFSPIFVMLADGEIAITRGEPARAIALADRLLARIRELKMRPFVFDVLLLKGKALRALNDLDAARACLIAAREDARDLGVRRSLWEILAVLSAVETARGDAVSARAARDQAREIVAHIAAHAPPELRDAFLGQSAVRMILADAN